MGSSKVAEARPVRSPPNSCCSADSEPSMRLENSSSLNSWGAAMATSSIANSGADAAAVEHVSEAAAFADGKHDDRNGVVAHERNGGGVHHLQIARQHLVVGQRVVARGFGILLGIGGVDAVDAGALEERIGIHLGGAQGGGGVSGEKRIAGAGGEDDD